MGVPPSGKDLTPPPFDVPGENVPKETKSCNGFLDHHLDCHQVFQLEVVQKSLKDFCIVG